MGGRVGKSRVAKQKDKTHPPTHKNRVRLRHTLQTTTLPSKGTGLRSSLIFCESHAFNLVDQRCLLGDTWLFLSTIQADESEPAKRRGIPPKHIALPSAQGCRERNRGKRRVLEF